MSQPTLSMIAAMSENYIIGDKGKIPWNLPTDTKWFRDKTLNHVIIMGRKTYESMGKPLPKRTNLVVTRDKNYQAEGCIVFDNLEKAIDFAKTQEDNEIFIVGGSEIYKQSLVLADKLYLTIIEKDFDGDAFFPEYKDYFKKIESSQSFEENNLKATFFIFVK